MCIFISLITLFKHPNRLILAESNGLIPPHQHGLNEIHSTFFFLQYVKGMNEL